MDVDDFLRAAVPYLEGRIETDNSWDPIDADKWRQALKTETENAGLSDAVSEAAMSRMERSGFDEGSYMDGTYVSEQEDPLYKAAVYEDPLCTEANYAENIVEEYARDRFGDRSVQEYVQARRRRSRVGPLGG